jgi:DNA repair protein RadC
MVALRALDDPSSADQLRDAPDVAVAKVAELLWRLAGRSVHDPDARLARVGGLAGLAALEPSLAVASLGLGGPSADRVEAALELARRMASRPAEPGWRVRSPADVGERMRPAMQHLEHEELRVLLLNTKNVVLAVLPLYRGNLAGSSVRVGEVFRDAVRRQAAAIVVVHNHPSGDPGPSADDVRITGDLAEAGRLLDIELLDHVVVAANGWVSLRAMGVTG